MRTGIFGIVDDASAEKGTIASSQGRPRLTPAPRRSVLREIAGFRVLTASVAPSDASSGYGPATIVAGFPTGSARCRASLSRLDFGGAPSCASSKAGTLGGGGGGGVPKIASRIKAPRKTGLVRYGYDDTARTAGMPSRPPR